MSVGIGVEVGVYECGGRVEMGVYECGGRSGDGCVECGKAWHILDTGGRCACRSTKVGVCVCVCKGEGLILYEGGVCERSACGSVCVYMELIC